MLEIKSSTF